ncbi:hypothetical protein AB1L08_21765, partial [Siminovitchia sp. 179-K 8D1 HS]
VPRFVNCSQKSAELVFGKFTFVIWDDNRWEHLVWAYKNFYPIISGVNVPLWILETIKHWYFRIDSANFILEEFSQRVSQLFFGQRK